MKPGLITLTQSEYLAQPSYLRSVEERPAGPTPMLVIRVPGESDGASAGRTATRVPVLFVEGPTFPYQSESYAGPDGWPAYIARRNSRAVCEIDEAMYWHWLEIRTPVVHQAVGRERFPITLPDDGIERPVAFVFAEGESVPTLFWYERQSSADSPSGIRVRYFCQRGPWETPTAFFCAHWDNARLRDFAPLSVHYRQFKAGDDQCGCDWCREARRNRSRRGGSNGAAAAPIGRSIPATEAVS